MSAVEGFVFDVDVGRVSGEVLVGQEPFITDQAPKGRGLYRISGFFLSRYPARRTNDK